MYRYNARSYLMPIYPRILKLASPAISLSLLTCAPAYPQVKAPGSDAPIDVRAGKEARAPEVMAAGTSSESSGGSSSTLDEATELEVLQEVQKRLNRLEKSDPARALAEYKKFWQGRTPHPSVAIQVALKIVQLRLQMKDTSGALLTCNTILQKYAEYAAVSQLALLKANILVRQGHLNEALSTVDAALPSLLSLGPQSYSQLSESLLSLAQLCVDNGSAEGKQKASEFYEGVEQVYLRWLRQGTLPHTWQMFTALQAKYAQVGDIVRATSLLPKAVDVLVTAKPSKENPEGGDSSVEAARWLVLQGHTKEAEDLYAKVDGYQNPFVAEVAALDRGNLLISQGRLEEARTLLTTVVRGSTNAELRLRAALIISQASFNSGDFTRMNECLQPILREQANYLSDPNLKVLYGNVEQLLLASKQWEKSPFVFNTSELRVSMPLARQSKKIIRGRLFVHTMRRIPLVVSVDHSRVQARLVQSPWAKQEATDSIFIHRTEIIVEVEPLDDQKDASAVLTIQSPELPGVTATMPIRVLRQGTQSDSQ